MALLKNLSIFRKTPCILSIFRNRR